MTFKWVTSIGTATIVVAMASTGTAAKSSDSPTRPANDQHTPHLVEQVRIDPAEVRMVGAQMAQEHALARAESAAGSTFAPALATASSAPNVVGQWAPPQPNGTAVIGVHTTLLNTGKVLMFSQYSYLLPDGRKTGRTMAEVWDPKTETGRRVDPSTTDNLFCGAATTLADGTVLVVGGVDILNGGSSGIPVVYLFDPRTETWSQAPSMRKGRWYPTVIETMNGGAVIVGGRDIFKKANWDVETFGPSLTAAPQLVGTYNLDYQQGLYPNGFLLPNGSVFWFAGDRSDFMNTVNWRIDAGPIPNVVHMDYPNAIMLPLKPGGDVEVALYGGKNKFAGTNTAVAERINLSVAQPSFRYTTPMPQPRANMNSVALPDGSIVVVGGNGLGKFSLAYLQTLLYNPTADTWTPMASQALRRAYHSTAILLADGRVLSAGDNGSSTPGGGGTQLEIYSPPYLSKGPRPVITSAPLTVARGGRIAVSTNINIAKLVLIQPSSTTHATDMHQRTVELFATARPAGRIGLRGDIPADGTVPPGPYMLFAVDSAGIPSVATWIKIT